MDVAIASGAVPEQFWKLLSITEKPILLLDYDGTLAPFRVERNRATPYPGVSNVLKEIMAVGTRVVVITGRPINELVILLNISPLPEIWGAHGLERLLSGSEIDEFPLDPKIERALNEAALAARSKTEDERVEVKHGCVALHWRGVKESIVFNLKNNIEPVWQKIASLYKLELLNFDGGLELRVPGRNKGYAVHKVITEADDQVIAAYLGDDLTDEDGFRAVKAARGLSILVRPEYRETEAEVWLQPPGELLDFLNRWLHVVANKDVR